MVILPKKRTKATYKEMKERYGDEYWAENDLSPLANHKYRLAHMAVKWGESLFRRSPRMNYNCLYQLTKEGFIGTEDLQPEWVEIVDNINKLDFNDDYFDTDPVKATYGI